MTDDYTTDKHDDNKKFPLVRGDMEKMRRAWQDAWNRSYTRAPDGKLKPREEFKHDAVEYAKPRVVESDIGHGK